jgi:hypothetical protein
VYSRSILGAKANVYNNAFRTETLMSLSRHLGVWIIHCGNNARDSGAYNRIRAGRTLSLMRAWLQRYIHGRTLRRFFRSAQGFDLSVGPAAILRPPASDNDAILYDYGADGRVRPCMAKIAASERQRETHEALVFSL